MKLPTLQNAEKYRGLYVYDFGDQVAVGYTAEEIAILLESERFRGGKVYRIHRAQPDGSLELQGVSQRRFELEEGLMFYQPDRQQAVQDFDTLRRLAQEASPPCRAKWQLAKLDKAPLPYLTALIYPAEYSPDVSEWLNEIGFDGGERVEGGCSVVTDYYQSNPLVLSRHQFHAAGAYASRSAEEVFAGVNQAVQR